MIDEGLKANSDPTLPLLIVGFVMLLVGLVFWLFPKNVRRYDMQLTRYIKDAEDYAASVRVFGLFFLFLALILLVWGGVLVFLKIYNL